VVKMRNSDHSKDQREYAITAQGMIVRDWSQLAIEKGDYMPQVEALISGGSAGKK